MKTSTLAIWSLVLSIVGLFVLGITSIPAVICGHKAVSQINENSNEIGGQGIAIAGLVIGYLGLLPFACLVATIAIPTYFHLTNLL